MTVMLVEPEPAPRAWLRGDAPGEASIEASAARWSRSATSRCGGSAASVAKLAEHIGIRLQQAVDRDAALGVVRERGDDRLVRPVRGGGPGALGAGHIHDDALRHPGLGGRAQRARRFLFPRDEAAQPPGSWPERSRRARHHRSSARSAVADFRHGKDRWIHRTSSPSPGAPRTAVTSMDSRASARR